MTCMEPTPEIASALLYHTCEWPPDDRVTALGLHGKKSITNQRERHRKRKGGKYSLGSPELAAATNTFLALSQQNSLTLKILNEAFSLYRSLARSHFQPIPFLFISPLYTALACANTGAWIDPTKGKLWEQCRNHNS